ncbi:MAG: hypothetical protein COB95_03050 [Nitrosopumilales archaeon]|nr:MAG: hypothetical protein COB95_03050 [Nitrosopumilales archaeon]
MSKYHNESIRGDIKLKEEDIKRDTEEMLKKRELSLSYFINKPKPCDGVKIDEIDEILSQSKLIALTVGKYDCYSKTLQCDHARTIPHINLLKKQLPNPLIENSYKHS